MYRKLAAIAAVTLGLSACAADEPAKPVAAAQPTKCQAELKKLDGAILGAYTKLSADQFDKVSTARENLSLACDAKADDAKVDTMVADATKILTAPPPPPPPTKCQASLKNLDNAILGAYTKLKPAQFDKATALREQLAQSCVDKASDDKVDTLMAEATKVLTQPAAAKAPAKKKTTKKK
jgi:hypothetical protein